MRIARVEYQRYRVGFRTPFTTSRGTEHARCGVLVRLITEDGLSGLGEAAPLPEFGTGTVDETGRWVRTLGERLTGKLLEAVPEVLNEVALDPTTAPACFAFDTAALDIEAQSSFVPLARHLRPDAGDAVPVNATVGVADPDQAAASAARAVSDGFRAIKLKTGVMDDLEAEVERVRRVRFAIGDGIELRLDANGAWTRERACAIASRLVGLDIGYLEQPLPPDDLDGATRLRSEIDIPIAADEAASTAECARRVIEAGAADVLIIKPGVIGGLRPARQIVELAAREGLRVVITTALETGVGIVAALHLAATLPQPIPACGLATGSLLESDLLVEPLTVSGDSMMLPSGPGLGVEVAVDRDRWVPFDSTRV